MRRAAPVTLARGEKARLTAVARSTATPARLAQRARIVLLAGQGKADRVIAAAVGTDPGTVARWRRRFLMQRLPGIERDAPRPGRPPSIPTSKIQVLLRSTLGRRPPGGGYWSARSLAREVGVSKTTVQRVWKAHGIEPRRAAETFRSNPGSGFIEKITDLVGLYVDPPERAMVFSTDPRARGRGPRLSRSSASEANAMRRRGVAFRAFLQGVDREAPKGLELHLLVDSQLTPNDVEVRRWLVRHPRIFLHYIPPGAGGPNLMERWFAQFTGRRPGAAAYPSVLRLHRALRSHLSGRGAAGRPFVWTATAEEIRGRAGASPDRPPGASPDAAFPTPSVRPEPRARSR